VEVQELILDLLYASARGYKHACKKFQNFTRVHLEVVSVQIFGLFRYFPFHPP
jgi:hypothetical protein